MHSITELYDLGHLRKGAPLFSPARREGGTQSDGEEELQERRAVLAAEKQTSSSGSDGGGNAIWGAARAMAQKGPKEKRPTWAYPSLSDDEDDFAYMAMKPAVIQARKHVMTGGNREMSESKGSLASSSGGPAEVRAALLLAANRRRYGGESSKADLGDGDGDDEYEDEEGDGVGDRTTHSEKKRRWWRAREKQRKEELRQDESSVTAAHEKRRLELLSRVRSNLLKPLSPFKSQDTPNSSKKYASALGGAPAAAAGGQGTIAAMVAARRAKQRAGDGTAAGGSQTARVSRPSTPKEYVRSALGFLPSRKSAEARERRFTHDGTTTPKPVQAVVDTTSFAGIAIDDTPLRQPNLDAEAQAVFSGERKNRPQTAPAPAAEDLLSDLPKKSDLPDTWGKPINLPVGRGPTPHGGDAAISKFRGPSGLVSSLGDRQAQKAALRK